MSFVVRLEQVMAQRGLTAAELAKKCSIDRSTISRYLSGERAPRFDHLRIMAKVLRVSLDHLAGEAVDRGAPGVADVLEQVVDETKRRLGLSNPKDTTAPADEPDRSTSGIPVLGKVSAGEGFAFDDNNLPLGKPEYTIPRAGDDDPAAYALVLDDESMKPFEPGSEVVAGPSEPWQSGRFAIIRLNSGKILVGRGHDKGETILLQFLNSAYEPEIIAKDDIAFIQRLMSIRPK